MQPRRGEQSRCEDAWELCRPVGALGFEPDSQRGLTPPAVNVAALPLNTILEECSA